MVPAPRHYSVTTPSRRTLVAMCRGHRAQAGRCRRESLSQASGAPNPVRDLLLYTSLQLLDRSFTSSEEMSELGFPELSRPETVGAAAGGCP
jgi:hypothetical protein